MIVRLDIKFFFSLNYRCKIKTKEVVDGAKSKRKGNDTQAL